jgi:hypothetical protein
MVGEWIVKQNFAENKIIFDAVNHTIIRMDATRAEIRPAEVAGLVLVYLKEMKHSPVADLLMRSGLKKTIVRCLNRHFGPQVETETQQITFAVTLQGRYSVPREGGVAFVRIEHCSDDDLCGVAEGFAKKGKSFTDHSRAILIHVAERRATA